MSDRNLACATLSWHKMRYSHQTQNTLFSSDTRHCRTVKSKPVCAHSNCMFCRTVGRQCLTVYGEGGGHEGTPVSLMIYKPGILLSVKNLHRLPGSWRFPLSVGVTLKSALLYMVLKRRKYRIDICKCGGDFVVDTLLVEWQMVAKWEKITVYHPVIDPSIFFFFFHKIIIAHRSRVLILVWKADHVLIYWYDQLWSEASVKDR